MKTRVKLGLLAMLLMFIVGLGVTTTAVTTQSVKIYKMAVTVEITTSNYIAYLAKQQTVGNSWVLEGKHPSLYSFADVTFKPIPTTAVDWVFPLTKEGDLWTSVVKIREGILWSDGEELDAEDVAFSYNGLPGLPIADLGGSWAHFANPDVLDHVEVIDRYTVKFYLKRKPGLAEWEYGLLRAPILPRHYWAPIFEEALQTADPVGTVLTIPGIDNPGTPEDETEPSAGPFIFGVWEQGKYVELERNWVAYPKETEGLSRVVECASGFFGRGRVSPVGPAILEITAGPNGELDTEPGGDDIVEDGKITAGSNGRLDTKPLGDDILEVKTYRGYRGSLFLMAGSADEFAILKGLEEQLTIADIESYSYNDAHWTVLIESKISDAQGVPGLWNYIDETLNRVKEALSCDTTLDFNPGPHVDAVRYVLYGDAADAAQAVIEGVVHYHLNPSGYEPSILKQLEDASNVSVIRNAGNGLYYLSMNLRREPFNSLGFRKAIDCLIDREYVTEQLLQGAAMPGYSVVPPGNAFWYRKPAPEELETRCAGFTRAEKVAKAVEYLKQDGFSWKQEPEYDLTTGELIREGKGLMLNGRPIRTIELLHPNANWDNMRNIFGQHVAEVANEMGIPVRSVPSGGKLYRKVWSGDFDMWIGGWGLDIYPSFLCSFFYSGADNNWQGYSNPKYDALCDSFLAEQDLERAQEIAFGLQEILWDELPYIKLYDAPVVEAYRSDLVEYPFTEVLDGLQGYGGMPAYVRVIKELENQPPIADFTYSPRYPTTADEVRFQDRSSDPDGIIVAWSWDFGDGSGSTKRNPRHRYRRAGTYTVTLTVTDDLGATATVSKDIKVRG